MLKNNNKKKILFKILNKKKIIEKIRKHNYIYVVVIYMK